MSARTVFSNLARNVASSSRLPAPRAAIANFTRLPLRCKSTLHSLGLPTLTNASLCRQLQKRDFRSAPTLYDDRSRTEAFLPEVTPSSSASDADLSSEETPSIPVTGERTPIGQIEQRLAITFTCSVEDCGHRSTHEFSKRSYTKGIVIVQCPGCKNRHLIADNLSWFTETEDEPRTIEQMIEAKGGKVRRGTVGVDGETGETIEILS